MSIDRVLTINASVLRPPAIVGGKRGEPELVIARLMCTPLDPADNDLVERMNFKAPMTVLQTITASNQGIKTGDLLVVDNRQYPIRACLPWDNGKGRPTTYQLILEDIMS
jgi:hypothetical protein